MQTIKDKPGLADLKRLRQQAEAAEAPAPLRRKGRAGARTDAAEGPAARVAGAKGTVRDAAEAAHGATGGPAAGAPAKGAAEAGRFAGASHADPPLAPEDKALFRQAVKSVKPLAPVNRAILPPVPAASAPILKQRRQAATGTETLAPAPVSDHYASPLLAPDASHFVQAGHGPDLLKSLARGKWPISASLDLHGATLDEARQRMDGFLRSCLQHRIRCVRIVHGKGHGSKNNAPVLKETVRRWLTQLDDVMAYIECSERDGGAGAVQVLLKAADPSSA